MVTDGCGIEGPKDYAMNHCDESWGAAHIQNGTLTGNFLARTLVAIDTVIETAADFFNKRPPVVAPVITRLGLEEVIRINRSKQ